MTLWKHPKLTAATSRSVKKKLVKLNSSIVSVTAKGRVQFKILVVLTIKTGGEGGTVKQQVDIAFEKNIFLKKT